MARTRTEKLNLKTINFVMHEKNITWQELALACQISKTTASCWKNQHFTPDNIKRKQMSRFLGVPVKDLVIPIDKQEYVDVSSLKGTSTKIQENTATPLEASLKFLLALSFYESYLSDNKDLYTTDDWQELTYLMHLLKKKTKNMHFKGNGKLEQILSKKEEDA